MLGRNKDRPKWGWRQRIQILLFVFVSTLPAAVLYLSSRSWKLPSFDFNKLFDFHGQYVFETSGRYQDSLEIKFRDKTNLLTGIYGFYFFDLQTGFQSAAFADRQFEAASLIKLPVMAAFWAEVEKGNLDPNQIYILENEDKVAGAGSLQTKPEGFEISYKDLVFLMGKQSDNTAYKIIRQQIGDEAIVKILLKAQMNNTDLSTNKTTPADIGNFYQHLLKGLLINSQHKDALLDSLTNTQFEEYLPSGIPEKVEVAHKYGREVHVLHDAGVIWAKRPYILVLMSEGIIDSEAEEVFPSLSRLFYNHQDSLAN